MSNLSDIGFKAITQEDFGQLIQITYRQSVEFRVKEGAYNLFSDKSGAEFWIQFNNKKECIGANPHFNGKSRRLVCLQHIVERPESDLDGAFYCWAAPAEKNDPGEYPFVFDLPDFRMIGPIEFPMDIQIQLTAFAQEIQLYDSEKEYEEAHTDPENPGLASQSFIPAGLFTNEEDGPDAAPQATGVFTGIIKEVEKKRNEFSGAEFYWMLVDTLGGEVDVVADPELFEKEPRQMGVVQGMFWLSGRLIDPPQRNQEGGKGFLKKLFRK